MYVYIQLVSHPPLSSYALGVFISFGAIAPTPLFGVCQSTGRLLILVCVVFLFIFISETYLYFNLSAGHTCHRWHCAGRVFCLVPTPHLRFLFNAKKNPQSRGTSDFPIRSRSESVIDTTTRNHKLTHCRRSITVSFCIYYYLCY